MALTFVTVRSSRRFTPSVRFAFVASLARRRVTDSGSGGAKQPARASRSGGGGGGRVSYGPIGLNYGRNYSGAEFMRCRATAAGYEVILIAVTKKEPRSRTVATKGPPPSAFFSGETNRSRKSRAARTESPPRVRYECALRRDVT